MPPARPLLPAGKTPPARKIPPAGKTAPAVQKPPAVWMLAAFGTLGGVMCAPLAVAELPVEAARPALRFQPVLEAARPLAFPTELVQRLGSPQFAVRAAASRDLARSGPSAVAPLSQAARSEEPEVAARAAAALESLWLQAAAVEDWPFADAAQDALLDLADTTDNPRLALQAEAVLTSHDRLLEERAVAEIRRLGGIVKYRRDSYNTDPDGSQRLIIERVVISSGWTGGEAGLKYVRLLPRVTIVYIIREADLPLGADQRLSLAMPRTSVQLRGRAYLGVGGSTNFAGGGCDVGQVEPDTAAARAGIKTNDTIISFDNQPVETFEKLIEILKTVELGKTVPVSILRGGVRMELQVTLEDWK